MKKCKHEMKTSSGKQYIRCELDNSIRKKEKCRNCKKYKQSFLSKLFG